LTAYSLFKNIVMDYRHVQKIRYGIRHRIKEKGKKEIEKGRNEERIPAVVRNEK
jgi:hypothetical protein